MCRDTIKPTDEVKKKISGRENDIKKNLYTHICINLRLNKINIILKCRYGSVQHMALRDIFIMLAFNNTVDSR